MLFVFFPGVFIIIPHAAASAASPGRYSSAPGATARRPGGGGLTVVSPSSLADISLEYDIATFKYYGNAQPAPIVGPGLVLNGKALCYPDEKVKGKIVIMGEWCGPSVSGSMSRLFEKYNALGALALVFVPASSFFPPGTQHYNFESWDRWRYSISNDKKNKMVLLSANSAVRTEFPAWHQAQEELHLRLAPPTRNQFQTLLGSWWWLISFRIVLPGLAFLTALDAFAEGHRIVASRRLHTGVPERDSTKVAFAVCALEGPSMLIFGASLAAGLYGPGDIPVQMNFISYTQFQGFGALTSSILALHLNKETSSFRSNHNAYQHSGRSLFLQYRCTIVILFIICVLPDLVAGYMAVTISFYTSSLGVFTAIYAVTNAFVATYFVLKARALHEPLKIYLSRVQLAGTESARRIGKLLFWLRASSLFMWMTAIWMTSAVFIVRSGYPLLQYGYFVFFFGISASRILASASQVQAVSRGSASKRLLTMLKPIYLRNILTKSFGQISSLTQVSPVAVSPQLGDGENQSPPLVMYGDLSHPPSLSVLTEEGSDLDKGHVPAARPAKTIARPSPSVIRQLESRVYEDLEGPL